MKKKILYVIGSFLIFFSLLLIKAPKISAAGGTFDCIWNSLGMGSCTTGHIKCDAGYVPDEGICEKYNKTRDHPNCIIQKNLSCISETRSCSTEYQSCEKVSCCQNVGLTCDVSRHCVKPSQSCSANKGICKKTECGSNEKDYGELDCKSTYTCCVTTLGKPTCNYKGGADNGINTAIGCIPFSDTNSFLAAVLKWAVGVGGGIAFLLMLYAGFMIMTASGSPDRLKAGQELLTSAIAGLILLIFSIFILKFIGIDILGLNNFGFGV